MIELAILVLLLGAASHARRIRRDETLYGENGQVLKIGR